MKTPAEHAAVVWLGARLCNRYITKNEREKPPKRPKHCRHKQTLGAPAAGLFAGGAACTLEG